MAYLPSSRSVAADNQLESLAERSLADRQIRTPHTEVADQVELKCQSSLSEEDLPEKAQPLLPVSDPQFQSKTPAKHLLSVSEFAILTCSHDSSHDADVVTASGRSFL